MRVGGLVIFVVVVGLVLGQTPKDLGAENVVDKLLQERTKQLLEDENFDLSSSPVHSRTTRNTSCLGVTEEVIVYK